MRSLKRTTTSAAVLSTALVVAATATAAPAPAADSSGSSGNRVLASGVGAPFQIARRGNTVFYTDGFAGTINKVTRKGPRVVARVPGVTGIEFSGDRRTRAISHGAGPESKVTLTRRGKRPVVVPVGQYEQNVNPDRNRTYGITTGASPACQTELSTPPPGAPPGSAPPATYKGIKDSNPYQLERLRRGAFALADAAGNSILRIGKRGGISLIALLPPQPIRLSASQAAAMNAPSCAGETYAFEPVPTDVERGPDGALWVSTLPGGPESPALGARGAVYRIKGGSVRRVAGGFLGATNLDVIRGRVYVTEFFAGKVTKFGKGGRFTRYNAQGAVSVEATRKHLYIGTLGMGPSSPGKVVRLPR